MRKLMILSAGLLALAVLTPLADSRALINIVLGALYVGCLATAWNIVGGLAGQFSLGHSLFVLAGAMSSGYLYAVLDVTPWLGMLVGAAVAGLIALVVGALTFSFRLRGLFFALVTLVLAQAGVFVVEGIEPLGGQRGLTIPFEAGLANLQFTDDTYYLIWLVVLLSLILFTTEAMSRSRLGYQLRAIRENETAAEAVGVNARVAKIKAFVVSAAFTALAGSFYAQYYGFIEARSLGGSFQSIELLLPAVVGGTAFVLGPLVGAVALQSLAGASRQLFGSTGGIEGVIYGAATVVLMWVLPTGLASLFRRRRPARTPGNDADTGGRARKEDIHA